MFYLKTYSFIEVPFLYKYLFIVIFFYNFRVTKALERKLKVKYKSACSRRLFARKVFLRPDKKMSLTFYYWDNLELNGKKMIWYCNTTTFKELPYDILHQWFSTFFGSRHPVRLKKIWRHPYLDKWQFGAPLVVKELKKVVNSIIGGTPDTSSRHPGWEPLSYTLLQTLSIFYYLFWSHYIQTNPIHRMHLFLFFSSPPPFLLSLYHTHTHTRTRTRTIFIRNSHFLFIYIY